MDNFFIRRLFGMVFFSFIFCMVSIQTKASEVFTRSFWQPTYHGLRLNYCTPDGKDCGLKVANPYCKMMGYEKAVFQKKAFNVGLTQYLSLPLKCVGWSCNGFKNIRCQGRIAHKPPEPYHYRLHRFAYPRYNNYRVSWCYDGSHHSCGKPAAFSFCRRMGYRKVRSFSQDPSVPATKALGNQKLCFANSCQGFKAISCYR